MAFSGWTCSQCGTFVPNGCAHSCPSSSVLPYSVPVHAEPPKVETNWLNPYGWALDRIAGALERIAAAMEKEAENV